MRRPDTAGRPGLFALSLASVLLAGSSRLPTGRRCCTRSGTFSVSTGSNPSGRQVPYPLPRHHAARRTGDRARGRLRAAHLLHAGGTTRAGLCRVAGPTRTGGWASSGLAPAPWPPTPGPANVGRFSRSIPRSSEWRATRSIFDTSPTASIAFASFRATVGSPSRAFPMQSFDLLVLDAFSSDAIPVHLLTREALAVYGAKLAEGGAMLFHLSNRHLQPRAGAGRLVRDAGLSVRFGTTRRAPRHRPSSGPSRSGQ